MGLFEGHFPYANFHQANLDWLIKYMEELAAEVEKVKELVAPTPQTITAAEFFDLETANNAEVSFFYGVKYGSVVFVSFRASTPDTSSGGSLPLNYRYFKDNAAQSGNVPYLYIEDPTSGATDNIGHYWTFIGNTVMIKSGTSDITLCYIFKDKNAVE